MRLSLTGGQVGWMMYTSELRTFSRIWIDTSPSLNRPIFAGVSGTPRRAAISSASSGLALPARSCMCARWREPRPPAPLPDSVRMPMARSGRRDLKSSFSISTLPQQNASFSSRFSNSGRSSIRPAQVVALVVLLHDLLEALLVDPHEGLRRPSERYES